MKKGKPEQEKNFKIAARKRTAVASTTFCKAALSLGVFLGGAPVRKKFFRPGLNDFLP